MEYKEDLKEQSIWFYLAFKPSFLWRLYVEITLQNRPHLNTFNLTLKSKL